MENFSLFYSNDEDAIMSYSDIRNFQLAWNIIDVNRKGVVKAYYVRFLLRLIPRERVGFDLSKKKDQQLFKEMCYEVETLRGGKDKEVSFHDVLMVLAYRTVDITKTLQLEELIAREEFEYAIEEEVARQTIATWIERCIFRNRQKHGHLKFTLHSNINNEGDADNIVKTATQSSTGTTKTPLKVACSVKRTSSLGPNVVETPPSPGNLNKERVGKITAQSVLRRMSGISAKSQNLEVEPASISLGVPTSPVFVDTCNTKYPREEAIELGVFSTSENTNKTSSTAGTHFQRNSSFKRRSIKTTVIAMHPLPDVVEDSDEGVIGSVKLDDKASKSKPRRYNSDRQRKSTDQVFPVGFLVQEGDQEEPLQKSDSSETMITSCSSQAISDPGSEADLVNNLSNESLSQPPTNPSSPHRASSADYTIGSSKKTPELQKSSSEESFEYSPTVLEKPMQHYKKRGELSIVSNPSIGELSFNVNSCQDVKHWWKSQLQPVPIVLNIEGIETVKSEASSCTTVPLGDGLRQRAPTFASGGVLRTSSSSSNQLVSSLASTKRVGAAGMIRRKEQQVHYPIFQSPIDVLFMDENDKHYDDYDEEEQLLPNSHRTVVSMMNEIAQQNQVYQNHRAITENQKDKINAESKNSNGKQFRHEAFV